MILSTRLATLSTCSTRLSTRSNRLSTCTARLPIRLSFRSTRRLTHNICLSNRSTYSAHSTIINDAIVIIECALWKRGDFSLLQTYNNVWVKCALFHLLIGLLSPKG